MEVPTTWDELKAACEKLKAYDSSIYPWGIDMTTDEGQAALHVDVQDVGGGVAGDAGVDHSVDVVPGDDFHGQVDVTLSLRKDVLPRRGRRFYQLVYKEDHEE